MTKLDHERWALKLKDSNRREIQNQIRKTAIDDVDPKLTKIFKILDNADKNNFKIGDNELNIARINFIRLVKDDDHGLVDKSLVELIVLIITLFIKNSDEKELSTFRKTIFSYMNDAQIKKLGKYISNILEDFGCK